MPERIQRKRTAGSRLPANTVCVTRPGKWGNPFTHDGTPQGKLIAAAQFRLYLKQRRNPPPGWADVIGYPSDEEIRRELAGKHLACWCPVGAACHGDELLATANQKEPARA